MVRRVTRDVIEGMTRAIVAVSQPECVILFGSRARGDAGAESDVDFIVVTKGPFERRGQRREELARIRRALAPFRVPTDILVYTEQERDKWRGSTNHVLGRSERDGTVLYERS